jgi:selT/selW/selH-like putative selenoprotein
LKGEFNVEVTLVAGAGGIFEVAADGREIFSKKRQGRFPNPGEIAGILKKI